VSPYVRTVKTASGATAVQIMHSSRRGSRVLSTSGPRATPPNWSCGQYFACRPDDQAWIPSTSRLVPSVTVIGLSAFSLSVRHGTLSTVISSCTSPESVKTSRDNASSAMKSR
jgi:hypothetical protein